MNLNVTFEAFTLYYCIFYLYLGADGSIDAISVGTTFLIRSVDGAKQCSSYGIVSETGLSFSFLSCFSFSISLPQVFHIWVNIR